MGQIGITNQYTIMYFLTALCFALCKRIKQQILSITKTMRMKKQSLLVGPDVEYEGSSTLKSRSSTGSKTATPSGLVQRRSSPTSSGSIRQMKIIKEENNQ